MQGVVVAVLELMKAAREHWVGGLVMGLAKAQQQGIDSHV